MNFGAWYPRYSVLDPHHPWPAWQQDMKELLMERLATSKARTFWRSYAAAHYGGTNGTNTFEEVRAVHRMTPHALFIVVFCLQGKNFGTRLAISHRSCIPMGTVSLAF